MRRLDGAPVEGTMTGLAHGSYVPGFIERWPHLVDYVEMPFEQLRHDPTAAGAQRRVPLILHCASMSVAGFVRPEEATLDAIEAWATETGTPWIGEHLAYILADPPEGGGGPADSPTSLTYTVCPQLSEQTLERVLDNLHFYGNRFAQPIILENPPQYFHVPGSTMSLAGLTAELCARSDLHLLLDLTHFLVSAMNMGFDASRELERLPLERVVEVHVSGLKLQSGTAWDDHANPAPERVLELLRQASARARPRAVTFEYNWAPDFPDDTLVEQINRVREMLPAARA